MFKTGDKLIRRHDGKEFVVDYFFNADGQCAWAMSGIRNWRPDEVQVRFLDGSTDYYIRVANTQKYMLPDEQEIFKQTFQPWDDADLVPNP